MKNRKQRPTINQQQKTIDEDISNVYYKQQQTKLRSLYECKPQLKLIQQ